MININEHGVKSETQKKVEEIESLAEGKEISQGHIDAIDRHYWDPRERAMGVHNLLKNVLMKMEAADEDEIPTDWDVLCFAVEHVANMAIGIQDDDLIKLAVPLANWLYSTHYSQTKLLYGAPDRPKDLRKQKKKEQRRGDSRSGSSEEAGREHDEDASGEQEDRLPFGG